MEKLDLYTNYNNVSKDIIKYSMDCKKQEIVSKSPSDTKKRNNTPTTASDESDIIILECDTSNSSIEEDLYIKPMMWTINIEIIVKEWHKQADIKSHIHNSYGKKYRILFSILGLINIIIPIIAVFIVAVSSTDNIFYMVLLLINTVISAIISFTDPSKKAEQHRQFMNLYNEFVNEINMELVKPLFFRIPADLFMQKTLDRYNHLNTIAPVINT